MSRRLLYARIKVTIIAQLGVCAIYQDIMLVFDDCLPSSMWQSGEVVIPIYVLPKFDLGYVLGLIDIGTKLQQHESDGIRDYWHLRHHVVSGPLIEVAEPRSSRSFAVPISCCWHSPLLLRNVTREAMEKYQFKFDALFNDIVDTLSSLQFISLVGIAKNTATRVIIPMSRGVSGFSSSAFMAASNHDVSPQHQAFQTDNTLARGIVQPMVIKPVCSGGTVDKDEHILSNAPSVTHQHNHAIPNVPRPTVTPVSNVKGYRAVGEEKIAKKVKKSKQQI